MFRAKTHLLCELSTSMFVFLAFKKVECKSEFNLCFHFVTALFTVHFEHCCCYWGRGDPGDDAHCNEVSWPLCMSSHGIFTATVHLTLLHCHWPPSPHMLRCSITRMHACCSSCWPRGIQHDHMSSHPHSLTPSSGCLLTTTLTSATYQDLV